MIYLQVLVGILAVGAVAHDAAAFGTEAADQLFAQPHAGRVGVYGDVDEPFVLEVGLYEAVQPGEVGVGSGGHGDGVCASDGDERGGVQLTLGDDAFGGADDGIDVVGD